jgi:hypothetical protein
VLFKQVGNTFVPHFIATGLPLQTQWFMQDGARPHTANVILDFLHDTFDSPSQTSFPEKDFSEKATNSNGIESTNHSGLQRDN